MTTAGLFIGDVRDGLRKFAADGIRAQTCVTSPPYWGLRDYGTAQWDGGAPDCDHRAPSRFDYPLQARLGPTGVQTQASNAASDTPGRQYRDVCGKCGAARVDKQLGLEPTIAEYVANMVDVFRLVRDVLADDGTLWMNFGDSYAQSCVRHRDGVERRSRTEWLQPDFSTAAGAGLKPKDLCGIPWRVAFALQADGWYLRSDIIWHKPNPMPESVTDRPTKAHEYLFLLSKRERYYYDAAAIVEPISASTIARWGESPARKNPSPQGLNVASVRGENSCGADPAGRNRRTVWTIATEAYADAHFATFPTVLVEPCIMAGSRVGDIVLDPFMGSGTVAKVAQDLGRRWIGCELNPDYAAMIRKRTAQQGMALT